MICVLSREEATINAECWQHMAIVKTPKPIKNPLSMMEFLIMLTRLPSLAKLSPIGA